MKKILLILFLCPLLSTAQTNLPRFENDTLYTTSGYTIYEGQTLHFAKGTSAAGYFRFVKFHSNMARTDTYTLQNSTLTVNKLRAYKNSGPDKQTIRIAGTVSYANGSKADVDMFMEFEKAVTSPDGLPGELTVPEAFRTKPAVAITEEIKKSSTPTAETKKQTAPDDLKKILVADEIKKLFDLYKAGALTKEEYEAQKKKLLERQ